MNEAAERLRNNLRKGTGWPDEHLHNLDAALAYERSAGAAPLDVERALSSHQAAIDDQRKKYHCGPTTCSHDLAARLTEGTDR